jgi:hypothetical protein
MILDKLKEEVGNLVEDQVNDIKADIVSKLDSIFDEDLQKSIVDELNENINVPFINEATEEKALNFVYDILEDKVKEAIRKALA